MGCQKAIASKIIERKGNDCLAVKGNQEKLYEELKKAFESAMSLERSPKRLQKHEVVDTQKKPHGRYDKRICYTMPVPKGIKESGDWE